VAHLGVVGRHLTWLKSKKISSNQPATVESAQWLSSEMRRRNLKLKILALKRNRIVIS